MEVLCLLENYKITFCLSIQSFCNFGGSVAVALMFFFYCLMLFEFSMSLLVMVCLVLRH